MKINRLTTGITVNEQKQNNKENKKQNKKNKKEEKDIKKIADSDLGNNIDFSV